MQGIWKSLFSIGVEGKGPRLEMEAPNREKRGAETVPWGARYRVGWMGSLGPVKFFRKGDRKSKEVPSKSEKSPQDGKATRNLPGKRTVL